jgi:4-methyl-5(b-hydroxyethyl)-thiazole monophosphate biosynthesis
MDKRVVIVLADGYEDIEATAPIDLLRRAGAEVTVAGLGKKVILSSHRMTVVCDAQFEKCKDEKWDAIVLPGGGKGSKNLGESFDVVSTAVRLYGEGKIVAAICAAPAVVLGGSGILEGKQVTCYPGMEKTCPSIPFDQSRRVIVDGNLITAKGAGVAIEFSCALVGELFGKEMEEKLKEKIIF